MKCTKCGAQIEGDFCPYCGTKSETIETKEVITEQIDNQPIKNVKKESKPKKPIYKKWWFWVVVAILVINIFNRLGGNDSSSVDISEFEWNNMALAEIIPEPESNLGSHLMNSEDYLSVDVHEVSKEAYKEYVNSCREKGFTVDMSETDGYYSASNADGYELMLYYFDDEQYMSIDLNAPSEDAEENTETDSETSENKNTEENVEEKLSFEIIAGEAGEYGKKLIFNKGTEFEQERWYYSIPIGTYKITNIGDYMAPLMIYVDEININEDGWEEPVIAQEGQMLKINQETTITLEEGQVIYIQEPAIFSFEMQ